ncbi:MAG: hypothetical protein V7L23_33350 [Nostoc sp.]|uniref:hypothetical protein n=1 Tax=Nostoc sp. TaxID=1180 RepID=UPI002FEED4F7
MTLLTFQQVFGSNATQNTTTITFLKSDLLGLISQTTNTADSIFAGIINNTHQQFEGNLTDPSGNNIADQNGAIVTYDNHLYYSSTWVQFGGYYFPRNLLNTCFLYSQVQPYAGWEHPLLEETPGDWKSRLHKRSPPARTL